MDLSGQLMSDKDILRRIAERGMKLAHEKDTSFIDIFQHLLDEIERLSTQSQLGTYYPSELPRSPDSSET